MAEEKNNNEFEQTASQTEENQREEIIEPVFAEGDSPEDAEIKTEATDEVSEADAKIAELEAKLEEADNRYLRLQADLDNFRRRSRLDLEAREKYRAQSLITDLLPAIDNFERALKMEVENEQAKSVLQGMEMVFRSLLDALKKEGVEPIEAVGKEFDPRLHQAVMQVEDENYGPNIVVEEFQKGYKLKDRVIRPSMVKVSQ
ncbi:nucleotide exchange factor GrpE [Bacillus sp. V3-13]|uniref:nucleotide exchange factor GrpE n=1 Tax=Bacillus sp. V3-13 TaxID=2053728 RepID=UPI000C772A93|nr:nucleotide exchange factor GrpE [Bacillus sp. V3-13]PLR78104.1 nucleotide exchange factor GrpE [Bacillus sp. V3-13]